jgi:hypothetical protein
MTLHSTRRAAPFIIIRRYNIIVITAESVNITEKYKKENQHALIVTAISSVEFSQ